MTDRSRSMNVCDSFLATGTCQRPILRWQNPRYSYVGSWGGPSLLRSRNWRSNSRIHACEPRSPRIVPHALYFHCSPRRVVTSMHIAAIHLRVEHTAKLPLENPEKPESSNAGSRKPPSKAPRTACVHRPLNLASPELSIEQYLRRDVRREGYKARSCTKNIRRRG